MSRIQSDNLLRFGSQSPSENSLHEVKTMLCRTISKSSFLASNLYASLKHETEEIGILVQHVDQAESPVLAVFLLNILLQLS